jgi:hypothetical protein
LKSISFEEAVYHNLKLNQIGIQFFIPHLLQWHISAKTNQKFTCLTPLAANRTRNRTRIRIQNRTCRRPPPNYDGKFQKQNRATKTAVTLSRLCRGATAARRSRATGAAASTASTRAAEMKTDTRPETETLSRPLRRRGCRSSLCWVSNLK